MNGYDATLPRAERKRLGAFYSPEGAVEHLLETVGFPGPWGGEARLIDLACGAGAFLVPAARRLCGWLRERGTGREAAEEALAGAIWGCDIDPQAVALAREGLAAEAVRWGFGGARFPHVRAADALEPGSLPEADGQPFHFAVGNPPYLEAKKAPVELKQRCRRHFPLSARGAFDLFGCFVDAAWQQLAPGGRLGFILPNKFLIADYAEALRAHLLAEGTLLELADVSHLGIFQGTAVYPILLAAEKRPPAAGHRVQLRPEVASLEELARAPLAAIEQAVYARRPKALIFLPPADPARRALLDRLLALPRRLEEELSIHWTVSFHRAGLRDQFIFPEATGPHARPLLGGKAHHGNGDVRRYRIDWSGWWIDYDRERARSLGNPLPDPALFAPPKLLIAQNARRIQAAFDGEGWCCKDTFLVGRLRGRGNGETVAEEMGKWGNEEMSNRAGPAVSPFPHFPISSAERLRAALALLNSRLASFYYQNVFHGTHVASGYLHYLRAYLYDIPLPGGVGEGRWEAAVPELAALAAAAGEAGMVGQTFQSADRASADWKVCPTDVDGRIDEAIERLFELSAGEREIVRREVSGERSDGTGRRGAWRASGRC